jgi:hypothetical protein
VNTSQLLTLQNISCHSVSQPLASDLTSRFISSFLLGGLIANKIGESVAADHTASWTSAHWVDLPGFVYNSQHTVSTGGFYRAKPIRGIGFWSTAVVQSAESGVEGRRSGPDLLSCRPDSLSLERLLAETNSDRFSPCKNHPFMRHGVVRKGYIADFAANHNSQSSERNFPKCGT